MNPLPPKCVGQIVLARHCLPGESCKDLYFVFKFRGGSDVENPKTIIPKDCVIDGDTLTPRFFSDIDLCAIILPDTILLPSSVIPLQINEANPSVTNDEVLYCLGHPSGLGLKFCVGVVRMVETDKIVADLDAFQGNSGSPVFSINTGQVIGILLEGQDDLEIDGDKWRAKKYPSWSKVKENFKDSLTSTPTLTSTSTLTLTSTLTSTSTSTSTSFEAWGEKVLKIEKICSKLVTLV